MNKGNINHTTSYINLIPSSAGHEFNLLRGKKICVLTGSELYSQPDIEEMVIKLGGKKGQAKGDSEVYCCLACDKINSKIVDDNKNNSLDIISTDWLIDLVEMSRFRNPLFKEYIYCTPQTTERLSRYYDYFGDHFVCDVNVLELMEIVAGMHEITATIKGICDDEVDEITRELVIYQFASVKLHIPEEFTDHCMMDIVKCHLVFGGATLEDNFMASNYSLIKIDDKCFTMKNLHNQSLMTYDFGEKKLRHKI